MSTSTPWNYQPQTGAASNVKLFNPQGTNAVVQNGQIPHGDVSQPTSWSSWENQYGQYNNVGSSSDKDHHSGDSQNQNDYQGHAYSDSQQFYNLNPGIQPQIYNQGQYVQQHDPHGQPIQPYDPHGQPIQPYDPHGQPVQQYDAQGQPINLFYSQNQQFDHQNDNMQGQFDQQYDWNNQWNSYGYQQNWSENDSQQPSNEEPSAQGFNTESLSHNEIEAYHTEHLTDGLQNSSLLCGEDLMGPQTEKCESNDNEYSTTNKGDFDPEEGNHPTEIDSKLLATPQNLHPEISNESLVTINSSSTQFRNDDSHLHVENKLENVSIQDKSDGVNSENVNHSAVDGQGLSTESNPKTSKDSPVNSQTSDDWEMVPSVHNLVAPSNHSRQGSTDSSSNVHFFIGSTNISPATTPFNEDTVHEVKKSDSVLPPSNMIPRHSSSPMPPRNDVPATKDGLLPTQGPPTGSLSSGDNPFRKGKQPDIRGSNGPTLKNNDTQKTISSKNNGLKLDVGNPESGFPSPIPSVSEDSQNSSQSPIMPRKESPFQPPRRRNLSQSSNSFDDENSSPQNEQRFIIESKSDQIQKDSHAERKGAERKSGPMKADRSIGSMIQSIAEKQSDSKVDYNKHSYRGHDEKRPRSPAASNSARNISGRITPTKPPTGRTTPTKPASGRTTPGRSTPSRRVEREAYQKVVERRKKENISPATSLWENNDIVPKTNIHLAPAAPLKATTPVLGLVGTKGSTDTREVLSPVENLITSMSDHLSRENSPEKEFPQSKSSERIANRRETTHKEKHERNSSIDREIEMTKRMEDKERSRESYRDSLYREDKGYKGPARDDRNPAHRDERYRDNKDYRDREYERDRYYEAYYERQRNKPRDTYYNDERYERPRSRQSTIDDRAPSRQDQTTDRSKYDSKDPYYRDKYGRGYYDYYGNSKQYGAYYDPRYADYYGDSRYGKAYYDEYYSGQYPENYDRMSRYDYTWQNAGYYDQYRHDDSYSQRSDSRVHTPGSLSDSGDQPEGYSRASRASSRQGYPDDYNRGHYDPYYYGYDYYNNSYMEPEPPGRMTPEKYTIPHMCARFGPGGHLIKVMPNRPKEGQPATVEIHDISTMLEDRPEVEELKCFPGPLVRGDTHKNDVLSFCQQKAKACSENINMTDRDSAELIWKLLEVLIKQNGMIIGTDIADLLLEGHEPTTVEYSLMGMKISNSMDNLDADLDEANETSNVTMDRSVINKGHRSTEEVTDRFRHLLLYGRKKDALEWAMKNNLWGHALFLASKMDSKAHANVMTRFANSAMKMNDPLQTLYQLMSGRQPAAVSCITDERWGDWRPHLAMMLSNQTHKADLDRKCIMTMGDTLSSRGFLHASHFCYLMAQVGFGSYHKKTSKMVLIGSNHSLPLSEFAINEAIQCSEVYEYAMSLGNPSFFSPNLQYFKFLYACRMAENGFAEQALEYCEVIAKCINISPTVFQPTLVKLVFELASRLKKFDPEKQQVGDDTEDPMWLQNLQRINQGFEDGSIQPLSGSATPYCFVGTRSSSASGEVAGLTDMGMIQSGHYTGNSPYVQGQGQQIYHQGYSTEQNQVYTNDPNQYQGYQTQNQGMSDPMHNQGQNVDQTQGYSVDQSHIQQGEHQSVDHSHGFTDGQGYSDQGQGYTGQGQMYLNQPMEHQQNQQYQTQGQGQGYQFQHHELQSVPEVANQNQGHSSENQTGETTTHSKNTHQTDFSMYHQAGIKSGHRNSISSVGTVSSHADTDDEDSLNQSHKSDFDYFGAATGHQKIVAPRLRKRTESESSQVNAPKTSDSSSKQPDIKLDEKKNDKKNQPQGKGWFGGVLSKFIPKSKTEMKLPDDKDPSIVWDPVKKRWVNQDGDAEDDKPTAPPPKDMDLSATPGVPMPATATPVMGPPTGNRFARPRGRGARTQYVDVLNPKSTGGTASVPNSIFNVLPSSASSPAIFNPSNKKDHVDSSQQEKEPSQYTLPPSDQRIDSGESDSAEMPPPSGAPSMPMLFNPSSMSQPTTGATSQSGLKRYNQRRVYPKS